MSQPTASDPWETSPVDLDPELVETSRRLMAKSTPSPQPEVPSPEPNGKDLLIAQLEQEKQRLFQRNVHLVTEATRLRIENQHLLEQLSEQQRSGNWLTRLLSRLK